MHPIQPDTVSSEKSPVISIDPIEAEREACLAHATAPLAAFDVRSRVVGRRRHRQRSSLPALRQARLLVGGAYRNRLTLTARRLPPQAM